MRPSILPPTSGMRTVISYSTVSVVTPPDSRSAIVPVISPGLPGMVTSTLARSAELGLRPVASLVRRASLEDVFLHLTGRTLVD